MTAIARRDFSVILFASAILPGVVILPAELEAAVQHPYFLAAQFYRKRHHIHVWVNLIHRANPPSSVPFYTAVAQSINGEGQLVSASATSAEASNHMSNLRLKLPTIPTAAKPLYCCIGLPAGSLLHTLAMKSKQA